MSERTVDALVDMQARAEAAEAEVVRLRDKNKELNRRASKAEAAILEKHDPLRSRGERTFGRVFANAAAEAQAQRAEAAEGRLEAYDILLDRLFHQSPMQGDHVLIEGAGFDTFRTLSDLRYCRPALSDTAQQETRDE